jgi:hypothetical protein
MMEVLALSVIKLITQRFYANKSTLTLATLADTLKVSDIYIEDVVTVLQAHHFIITSSQQPPRYILSCVAENVKVNEVKVAITYGDKNQQQLMQDLLKGSQILKNAISAYSSSSSTTNNNNEMSLKDFALNEIS